MNVEFVDLPALTRQAAVVPASLNEEAGTVDVVASTGSTVRRRGWMSDFDERLVITAERVDLSRLNAGAPVLDTHSWNGGTEAIRGITVPGSARIEAGQVLETLRIDRAMPAGAELWRKIREGFVRFVSIGYDAEYDRIRAKDRTDGVNDVDLLESTKLEIFETSPVPAGADPGAGIRSAPQGATRRYAVRNREEKTMPPEPEKKTAAEPILDEVAKLAAEERGRAEAFERMFTAQSAAKIAGVTDETIIRKVATECRTQADIKARFMDIAEAAQRGTEIAGQVTMVRDEKDKSGDALKLVFEQRMFGLCGAGHRLEKAGKKRDLKLPDELSQRYRRKSLLDIAEERLRLFGVGTRGMSDRDIADLVLRDNSTSDFPLLLADSANKILIVPWETRPSPWLNFAQKRDAKDFKPTKLLRRSAAPKMEKIKEGGEVEFGTYGERQETIQLEEYGIGVAFTRRMLINDDLGAFATSTLGLGDSVVDNRDDLVVGVITGTEDLSDGYPLFHSAHKNIVTGTGAPSEALVEEAGELIGAQVETLPATAKRAAPTRQLNFGLTGFFGAQKEAVALEKVVNPRFVPTTAGASLSGMYTGLPIWWDNRLRTTPRYYYGMDVARSGLIYGGLQGEVNPRFSQGIEFRTNGVMFKVNDDFQVGLDSWEWIVRIAV